MSAGRLGRAAPRELGLQGMLGICPALRALRAERPGRDPAPSARSSARGVPDTLEGHPSAQVPVAGIAVTWLPKNPEQTHVEDARCWEKRPYG